jgi:integrase
MPYYDRSKKKWRGEVRLRTGRGVVRKTRLFATKKEATAWERMTEKSLRTPTQTATAFSTLYNEYLDFSKIRHSHNTFTEKVSVGKRFLAFLGADLPIDRIKAHHINEFLLQSAEAVSNNRANRDRKNLLSFWNWAQKIHDLPNNPVAKTSRLPHERKPRYVPNGEDIARVIMAASGQDRVMLIALRDTLARRSEIFRWRWGDDVDFEGRLVRLGTRKTRDGSMDYEWLPMTDDLYDALRWQFKQTGRKYEHVFVIPESHHLYGGRPYTTRRKFVASLCKRAGVRPFGFHDIRRYGASRLAAQGVPMKTIQRILRHKNITTTERYVGYCNQDLKATMEMLSEKSATRNATQKKNGLQEPPATPCFLW